MNQVTVPGAHYTCGPVLGHGTELAHGLAAAIHAALIHDCEALEAEAERFASLARAARARLLQFHSDRAAPNA